MLDTQQSGPTGVTCPSSPSVIAVGLIFQPLEERKCCVLQLLVQHVPGAPNSCSAQGRAAITQHPLAAVTEIPKQLSTVGFGLPQLSTPGIRFVFKRKVSLANVVVGYWSTCGDMFSWCLSQTTSLLNPLLLLPLQAKILLMLQFILICH